MKAYFEKSTATNESAKITMVNAGVDGATLQAIYNNLERALHDSSYDAVFIMGGTNDILHGRTAKIAIFQ